MSKRTFEPCIPTPGRREHDGYRLIVQRDGKRVRLFTRNGHDWTDRYPLIAEGSSCCGAVAFASDSIAIRRPPGTASIMISCRLPSSSGTRRLKPGMLPSGRETDFTNPVAIMSVEKPTIGTERITCAARIWVTRGHQITSGGDLAIRHAFDGPIFGTRPAHIYDRKFRFDLAGTPGNFPAVHAAPQIDVRLERMVFALMSP
jgi:hypothetical protein